MQAPRRNFEPLVDATTWAAFASSPNVRLNSNKPQAAHLQGPS